MHRVVVVGAGIAGSTAAALIAAHPGTAVTLLEAADRVGGKLRRAEVGGVVVDIGAESALARVPDATALITRVGLAGHLVHPTAAGAAIAVAGTHRPIPAGTVLGVPADLTALAASGLLSPAGLAAVAADVDRREPAPTEDVAVGALLRARLGAEVVDRLVEPLLGGIYAGRSDDLSLRATMPALAAALTDDGSVVAAARTVRARAAAVTGPVFASLRGGLAGLPEVLAATPGITLHTRSTVRRLERTADGFRLLVAHGLELRWLAADAVVLAVPAGKAAVLLADTAPTATADLLAVDYASVAVVTLAVPRQPLRPGSGVLVPPGSGGLVKAVTLSSHKWAHLDGGDLVLLRASVGRRGDQRALHRDDADLVRAVVDELRPLVGLTGEPVDSLVTRWGGALPQYDVGHLDRVRRIRAAVAAVPGLAVCGALYDGVGVAACIRSATIAAASVAPTGPGPTASGGE